ncbi:DUF5106 domain-containing protein [uncultured Muribaculum sp.]|uniref:DUF5106 domain-containing protein n=1 Tax=uncultured Muribaculum sp. TaxID=1918613 RepID=UPI0025AF0FE2|nr:DUF5106 domain-containing protein [uncultured Muribaculum sp.]
MKQIFRTISILAVVACFSSSVALSSGQEQGDAGSATSNVPTTPFEYPMAPDSLPTLQARTSYVMMHFWDAADMNKILSDTAKFNQAFHDFVSFIPYSYADSIKRSISILVEKMGEEPEHLLRMARRAEAEMYGPEADFWSEASYLMFLRPVLNNKKIKNKDKEYYLTQVKKLNSSQIGATFPSFPYTTRHGAGHNLYEYNTKYKYVLFHPSDCSDCSLTRLRLEADGVTSMLTEDNRLKIFVIAPDKPGSGWNAAMENYPYSWEIGYSPKAADMVDLRVLPTVYVLDENNKIIDRNLTVDQLLALSAAIYSTPTVPVAE